MQWWADLWDNWAKMGGYDVWEWGSAADWVGAIGTAGALIATVVIISSDKRRDRQKRANDLITWVAADPYGGTPQATGLMPTVMIENTGDTPILSVMVWHSDGTGHWHAFGVTAKGSLHGSLPPGASDEVEIPDYKYGKHDRIFVKFIDADNQHWTRNAATGKYLRRGPIPYSSPLAWIKFRYESAARKREDEAFAEKVLNQSKK